MCIRDRSHAVRPAAATAITHPNRFQAQNCWCCLYVSAQWEAVIPLLGDRAGMGGRVIRRSRHLADGPRLTGGQRVGCEPATAVLRYLRIGAPDLMQQVCHEDQDLTRSLID